MGPPPLNILSPDILLGHMIEALASDIPSGRLPKEESALSQRRMMVLLTRVIVRHDPEEGHVRLER